MADFIINQDFVLKEKKINKRVKKNLSGKLILENSFNLGYYLITPILVGVIFGLLLDQWLDKKKLFIILFLFFGSIASFYNLYRLIKDLKNSKVI